MTQPDDYWPRPRRPVVTLGDQAQREAQGLTLMGVLVAMAALILILLGVGLVAWLLGLLLAPLLLALTRYWEPGHTADYRDAVTVVTVGLLGFLLVNVAVFVGFFLAMEHTGLAGWLERTLAPLDAMLTSMETALQGSQAQSKASWLMMALFLWPLLLPGFAAFAGLLWHDLGEPYRGVAGLTRAGLVSLLMVAASTALVTGAVVGVQALWSEPAPLVHDHTK